jgi:hypothetical protein
MSFRSVLIAGGSVLALALAGCSSTVVGSPLAAETPTAVAAEGDDAGDLSLPTDAAENPIDPGDLVEGLGTGTMPVDPSDLGDLLESLGADGGTTGLGDLSGILSPECLSIAGQSMALSMLMLAPLMGQALTQSDIDQAFSSLKDVPPELQDAVATLRAAAESSVGASPADASALMSDPAVEGAMDTISKYMDDHCGGQ